MAIKRQQIIDTIKTKLAAIKTANGYYTNIGDNVFEWKANPMETSKLPGVEVRDTEETLLSAESQSTYNLHDFMMTVELKVLCAESTPTATVRKMIIDVYKLIGANLTWSDYAIYTYLISNAIDLDQQNKLIAGATITIQIYYRTTAWSES